VLYEIINMSDPYTIEAKSLDVALVACLFLGRGQYSFKPLNSDDAAGVPMFLFGGTEKWCQQFLGEGLESVVDRVTTDAAKRAELAECFDSCLIGRGEDRETYRAGLDLIDDPDKRELWRRKWHEDRLSSMNDIGGRAYKMAAKLRDGQANPIVAAPQQVFGI
jgi:hypothetical protein